MALVRLLSSRNVALLQVEEPDAGGPRVAGADSSSVEGGGPRVAVGDRAAPVNRPSIRGRTGTPLTPRRLALLQAPLRPALFLRLLKVKESELITLS